MAENQGMNPGQPVAYELVDNVINAWVKRHAFTLFDEFGGLPRRFVYLSGDEGECCQISIDPPVFGEIALYAFGVETRDDEEMEMRWQVPLTDLERALEDAVTAVKHWWLR